MFRVGRHRALAGLALTLWAGVFTPSCYLAEWGNLLSGQAFVRDDAKAVIVSDLRVLAIEATPSRFDVDPRVLAVEDEDPLLDSLPAIELSARFDVVDPRGGAIEATVRLCAGEPTLNSVTWIPPNFDPSRFDDAPRTDPEILAACFEIDFDAPPFDDEGVRAALSPRARRVFATPTEADPFGPIDPPLVERFVITPRVVRALATLVPRGLRDFNGAHLWIVVQVSRTVGGVAESEIAYVPLDLRVDPLDPALDESARADILSSVGNPPVCDEALVDLCRSETKPGCGNGIMQEGEECEPPNADLSCVGNSPEDYVCGFSIECLQDCRSAVPDCYAIGDCIWPPRLADVSFDGIDAFDPNFRVQDVVAVALNASPVPLGGVLRAPLANEGVRLAVAFDSAGLSFVQRRLYDWQVNVFGREMPDAGADDAVDARTRGERFSTELQRARMHVWVLGDTGTLGDRDGDPLESLSNGVEPIIFRPSSARRPGDRDVVRVAFGDGHGAWTSGPLTIEWE